MPDSREGRGARRPWRRIALALAVAPAAIALLTAATPASPTPGTAVLTVTKRDANTNAPLKGATFAVCPTDPACTTPVARITTDDTGTAQATLPTLPAGSTYCLRETAVPSGYRLMPTYSPHQCVPFAADTAVAVTDPPAPTPTPTPSATPTPTATPTDTPSPTPSPTAAPTGELQITKSDPGNHTITAPGFTFNIHVGSVSGQVIATIATDGSGIAVAGALNPATYCVEETAAPDGYQVAPTYSPAQCVFVASDSTQGHAPTLVTVVDPAAAPSPTATAPSAVGPAPSATPSAAGAQPISPQPPSSLAGALVRGLIGFGGLLLVVGAVMIAVAIRRRRRRPPAPPPPADYWYDSTIG